MVGLDNINLIKRSVLRARNVFCRAVLLCAVVFFTASLCPKPLWADLLSNYQSSAQYIANAFAKQSIFAGNTYLQDVYLGVINVESTFNTQATNGMAFGLGQIYYPAHSEQINAIVAAAQGVDASTVTQAQAEAYMLANPQVALDLALQVFVDNYVGTGGNLEQTLYNYGGSDSEYMSKLAAKMAENVAAGISSGTLIAASLIGGTTGGGVTTEVVEVDFSDCLDEGMSSMTASDWNKNMSLALKTGLEKAMASAAAKNSAQVHKLIDAAATGDIKKRYCIGDKLEWMQWSSVQTMLLGMIQAIISNTIQQVLDYVCAEEQAIVNNMLVKFCVPMPTFGNINLGLKADGMEACNGTKLLTLTTSTGVTVSPLPFPTAVTTFFTNLNTSGAK